MGYLKLQKEESNFQRKVGHTDFPSKHGTAAVCVWIKRAGGALIRRFRDPGFAARPLSSLNKQKQTNA